MIDRDWINNWQRLKQPKPPIIKNVIYAFIFGGLICAFGQLILNIYISLGVPQQEAGNPAVATVIFIAASFTAAGVFDNLAQFAGAGIAVPVTGFANSVTSMAMEFRREGLVTGTGAKMFALAGPIIVFGVLTAFIVGIISALI